MTDTPTQKNYAVEVKADHVGLFTKNLKRYGIKFTKEPVIGGVVVVRFRATTPLSAQMKSVLDMYGLEPK